MGINYSDFGLDDSVATDSNVARNRAIEAAINAINVQLQVLVERDEEDREILQERLDAAVERAETLRKEARLTKGEVNGYRSQVVQNKQVELAQRHLELEVKAKAKEAAGEAATAERADQADIEAGLATIERVLT